MVVKGSVVALVASLLVTASALGGTHATSATTVQVSAGKPTEFKFTVSKKRVPKGVVVFRVTNRGSITHDFKLGKKRTKLLAPGKSAVLRVTFTKAGKYRFSCTLPGHAAAGMKGVITVK